MYTMYLIYNIIKSNNYININIIIKYRNAAIKSGWKGAHQRDWCKIKLKDVSDGITRDNIHVPTDSEAANSQEEGKEERKFPHLKHASIYLMELSVDVKSMMK